MPKIESYRPGDFCWAELASTNADAAKAFYREMFGWSALDHHMPMGVYTVFQADGLDTAAVYSAPPNMPSHWGVYFSVESVDASAAQIEPLGGKIIMGPLDTGENGRMVVAQDSQGAMFSLWQAKLHIGSTNPGPLGIATWPELHTPEPTAAINFYSALLGWRTKPESGWESAQYIELVNSGKPFGSVMPTRGAESQGVPPHWMIYITLADCDAAAAKITSLGGKVQVPPTDIPMVGRFAVVNDPQGATFAIIKMSEHQPSVAA